MTKQWKIIQLGELCEFHRGLTYTKNDEVEISNNIVLRATNIDLTTNFLNLKELKYINDNVNIPNSKKVKKDSLIICTASGSKNHLGKVAYIDDNYNYAFGGFMGMITPKNGLNSKYLFHLMTSCTYKNFIAKLSNGTNINNLKFEDLKKFPVPYPAFPVQQQIVDILDETFEDIAKAKANAEKNFKSARTIFESQLNEIFTKKDWEQKTFKEVSTVFGRGKSKHRPRNDPKLYGGKYPFIQTGDIRNSNHFIKEHTQTYNETGLAQSKLWPKGTICITIAANIAETGILSFDACFPDSVIGMVVNPKEAEVGFVEYLLQSFKLRLQSLGKGSAQSNINLGTFENERFPFPSINEQKQIVNKLDSLNEEILRLESIYERKLTKLEALKKSLLHQAFSGNLKRSS